MAWPIDARHFDFAAGGPVPSATLNEIQDALIDLFGSSLIAHACGYSCNNDVSGIPNWQPGYGADGDNRVATNTASSEDLLINFPVRAGMVITGLDIKYFLATAVGLSWALVGVDKQFDADSVAPSIGTTISSGTFASAGGDWSVHNVTGLSYTVGAEEAVVLRIGNQDAGDKIAGARLTLRAFTR